MPTDYADIRAFSRLLAEATEPRGLWESLFQSREERMLVFIAYQLRLMAAQLAAFERHAD